MTTEPLIEFDDCMLDECQVFYPNTKEWGYSVICINSGHGDREKCPGEHEMFRINKEGQTYIYVEKK